MIDQNMLKEISSLPISIEKELQKVPNPKARAIAIQNVEDIKASNRRDFRF